MIIIKQEDAMRIFAKCSNKQKLFNLLRYGPVMTDLRYLGSKWEDCFELTFDFIEHEDNFVFDYGDLVLSRYDVFDDF